MRGCLVYRAERFSPNSADRDRAIMDAVATRLGEQLGGSLKLLRASEDDVLPLDGCDFCISMARSPRALDRIGKAESDGMLAINSAKALARCSRGNIERLMRDNGLPAAPLYSGGRGWIKRADQAAQTKADVVYVVTAEEMARAESEFRARGVSDVVKTDHVDGDLLKFYGVRGTSFFSTTYPTDGSYSKFGDERLNGKALHTPFDRQRLQDCATEIARLTGLDAYGGDCIVRADGAMAVIDFNDFPSFAACRTEAAAAIVSLTTSLLKDK